MERRRELVAAALFVLSRIRKTKGQEGILDLTELEKALDILADLSDPEERQRLSVLKGGLDSLERQRQDFLREYDARLGDQNAMLVEEVSALLLRHVPEDQRDEIKGRLDEVMAGDGGSLEGALELPERQTGASQLERKLRMLEGNSRSSGLEKFLDTDEGEVGD
jgi:hypothetical protein